MVLEPVKPELLPTVPIVNPPEASLICVAPIKLPDVPPATVAKLLATFVKVTVPVPFNESPAAAIAAVIAAD